MEKITNKTSSNKEITNKEKFLWILLGSVLDFIANIIFYHNSNEVDYFLTFSSSNLLLIVLFSLCLLKMKLYKHHYLSIIIIIIIGITYNFISENFDSEELSKNYKLLIANFFTEGTFGALYVLF